MLPFGESLVERQQGDTLMSGKPTRGELEQRVRQLEDVVSGCKRHEEALLIQKAYLEHLLDCAPEAIVLADRNHLITRTNAQFTRLFGYTPEEAVGRICDDIIAPPDRLKEASDITLGVGHGDAIRVETVRCRKGGSPVFVEVMAAPVWVGGEHVGDYASYRDITERKSAEEALRQSEEKYRTLFDESRDAIYITTREGKFLDANRALLDLFGYTKEELMGNVSVGEIYAYPYDRVRFQERIEQEGSVRNYEIKFRKKNGAEIDCLLTSNVRCSDDGNVLGYQGIIRDVTEQKRAEGALRERETHYRAMVEAFDGLIYICSQDHRVEFMNRRLIERTGHDATGELCYKALHDLDAICPWCVNERVFKGETVRWEVLSPKDDRWFYTVNTPIYHTDGSVSKQAMFVDITERKQMEETLRKSAEKTKQFAYSVSHDLKSPAIGIYGLAKHLHKAHADALGEKGKAYCDQILKAAEHISTLVAQINLYISTSAAVLVIERIKLKDILEMVREEFSGQIGIRQIKWSEPEHLPELNADRISILRVLRNLVDNALKYGGDDLTEIRLDYKDTDAFHILSVSNDGSTIKEEHFKKIFRPFQRYETARGVEGSGLGLAIVKELVEQHGGEVWVESPRENWAAFHVSISKSL
jgi:PAS domain S-box-containing protein